MQTSLDRAVSLTRTWRQRTAAATRARDELVKAVEAAAEDGIPELRIANETGLTRPTVRRWLGKDKAKKKLSQTAPL